MIFKDKRNSKTKGTTLIFFGLIILVAHLGTLKFQYTWGNIDRKDLVELRDCLLETPKINSGKYTEIVIRLRNHPDIRFENSQIFYTATSAESFINDYKMGDTISLSIWEYDYKTKVIISEARNIFERIASPSDLISFYSLKYKGKEYVNIEEINNQFYWKSFLPYLIWIACFGFIGYGFYLLFRKVSP